MVDRRKHIPVFVLFIVLILAISACQTTETEAPADAGNGESDVIVLRAGTGDSGEGLNPHQSIIADFEAENLSPARSAVRVPVFPSSNRGGYYV